MANDSLSVGEYFISLHICKCQAYAANSTWYSILYLDQDITKTDWSGIGDQLGLRLRIEVCQCFVLALQFLGGLSLLVAKVEFNIFLC